MEKSAKTVEESAKITAHDKSRDSFLGEKHYLCL